MTRATFRWPTAAPDAVRDVLAACDAFLTLSVDDRGTQRLTVHLDVPAALQPAVAAAAADCAVVATTPAVLRAPASELLRSVAVRVSP